MSAQPTSKSARKSSSPALLTSQRESLGFSHGVQPLSDAEIYVLPKKLPAISRQAAGPAGVVPKDSAGVVVRGASQQAKSNGRLVLEIRNVGAGNQQLAALARELKPLGVHLKRAGRDMVQLTLEPKAQRQTDKIVAVVEEKLRNIDQKSVSSGGGGDELWFGLLSVLITGLWVALGILAGWELAVGVLVGLFLLLFLIGVIQRITE